jgi:hypothetical protein
MTTHNHVPSCLLAQSVSDQEWLALAGFLADVGGVTRGPTSRRCGCPRGPRRGDTCDELGLAIITWIERRSRAAFLVMAGLDELARDMAAHVDDQAPGCPAGATTAGELQPGSGLADDEDLPVAGGVEVAPAGAARARRGARQRGEVGAPALVQRPGAGH